jgi:hypothetical protein
MKSGYARTASELFQTFTKEGHEVELITEGRGCSRVGKVAILNEEGKSILNRGCDIVQVIGPSPLFSEQCVSYAKARGLKVVYTMSAFSGLSTFYDNPLAGVIDYLYQNTYFRRTIGKVDLLVFNTYDHARSFEFYDGPYKVIPNGIREVSATK